MALEFERFKLPRLRLLPHRGRRLPPAAPAAPSAFAARCYSAAAAVLLRRSVIVFIFFAALAVLYRSALVDFVFRTDPVDVKRGVEHSLERVLEDAATEDKTVIITTLNGAWAAPNAIFDLFLKSFEIGNDTRKLLDHLVVVALDADAFRRCTELHKHCFALVTEGADFSQEAYFMTPDYLKMMWRRIDFLRSVLEKGYNFVFTDTDIMWFRDPFQRFYSDADFQIACDLFSGNSSDLNNKPNGGFTYVRSNNRTIAFYEFWHSSQYIYPGKHDQDVFNLIKHNPFISEIGLRIKFLSTQYFGGFCEPSKDLNLVCTMHANCCAGLDTKLHDLRIMLKDWRLYMALSPSLKRSMALSWRVPKNCSLDFLRHTIQSDLNPDDEGEDPS